MFAMVMGNLVTVRSSAEENGPLTRAGGLRHEKMRRESCCVELWEGFVRHFCVLTLDFVTVNYFPVVYVALRHFIILYIFVRQIIAPTLI